MQVYLHVDFPPALKLLLQGAPWVYRGRAADIGAVQIQSRLRPCTHMLVQRQRHGNQKANGICLRYIKVSTPNCSQAALRFDGGLQSANATGKSVFSAPLQSPRAALFHGCLEDGACSRVLPLPSNRSNPYLVDGLPGDGFERRPLAFQRAYVPTILHSLLRCWQRPRPLDHLRFGA